MTKSNERLALVERQRRFEWELARQVQTRVAARFVAAHRETPVLFGQQRVLPLEVRQALFQSPGVSRDTQIGRFGFGRASRVD